MAGGLSAYSTLAFWPSNLFDCRSVAMAGGRQVGIPAGDAAKGELQFSRVARRNGTAVEFAIHLNSSPTHRTDGKQFGHAS
jgi:hypothetical protein